jgi:sigma-B regulation protein RsbU (phosphoserine phosphatase)
MNWHVALSLVNLFLLGCILLVVRQLRYYLEGVASLPRPEDPTAAEIHDSCAAVYQPIRFLLLPFGLLWVIGCVGCFTFLRGWESDVYFGVEALGEGLAILLVCWGLLRLIHETEKHQSEPSLRTLDMYRRGEEYIRFFERIAVGAGLLVFGAVVVIGAWGKTWEEAALVGLPLVAVWELGMLLGAAYYVRETPDSERRGLAWVLLLWGGAVMWFAPTPSLLVTNQWVTAAAFLLLLRFFVRELTGRLTYLRERVDYLVRERRIMLDFMARVGPEPGSADFEESFDLPRIMKRTLTYLARQVNASGGAVFLRREDDPESLSAVAVEGFYPPSGEVWADRLVLRQKFLEELVRAEVIHKGEGLVGEVALTGEGILVKDAADDPRVPDFPVDYLRIQTAMVLPLRAAGQVMGVVSLINKRVGDETFAFTAHDRGLAEAIAEQAAIVLNNVQFHRLLTEQKILDHEMQIAQDVHAHLLPKEFPSVPGYELGALSRAARRVGGDYYDFIWIDASHLLLVVADVSGKGVPGAITMAMVKSALKALLTPRNGKPLSARQILCDLNDFVYRDTRRDAFVSMSVAILDVPHRRLCLARAGHEPVIVLGGANGRCDLVTPDGIALGLDSGTIFRRTIKETDLRLQPGDTVVLYTDGVTEAMNREKQMFSFERFLQILKESKGRGAQQVLEAVDERVTEFTGDTPPHDDLTLVLLRVLEADPSKGGSHVEKI